MKSIELIEKRLNKFNQEYAVRYHRANELDDLESKGETIDKIERQKIEHELVSYFVLITQFKWILADDTTEDNL